MKKFTITLITLLSLYVGSFAQQKVSQKAVISIPGLQPCEECAEKLQLVISREEGVTGIVINVKKKTITATWLTDRTSLENIKVAIANLGYKADDIEAEETAYKRLPKCCKIPEVSTITPPKRQ
ncbi:MAG: heavy-metal-associated domain-containing protein [Ferruginibacter sp.]|nr:heavy-metal-associated domain-containing protein [Ferruginibacter sp.]